MRDIPSFNPETNKSPELTIRESVSKKDMVAIKAEGSMSVSRSSSGPGGQNVNKTAKTAEFRWKPAESSTFNDDEKNKISDWFSENRPSLFVGDGEIYITSTEMKSLDQNKRRVMQKLHELLTDALHTDTERIATKPSKGSNERRIREKKQRGNTKKQRGRVTDY